MFYFSLVLDVLAALYKTLLNEHNNMELHTLSVHNSTR